MSLFSAPVWAQNAAVTVQVDVAAGRRPISPLVYGLNYAENLSDLNCPINRIGGNNTTRYNWKQNADNKAGDYFFQSIGDADATPGKRIDSFVALNKAGGAQSMVTIPILGWVAKLNADRSKRWSFSISKYGAQQANDWQWCPDAGNGVRPDGSFITGNDPNDANVPSDPAFMRGWVDHLLAGFGTAQAGGVRYYILDNEPGIWHATHRDVHPVGATMDDVWAKMRDYAQMIKTADPGALVVGPEEWGWTGYLYSGYDSQYGQKNGWWNLPDRAAHGGQDFMPWLLSQFKAQEAASGKRLLDVFSLHFYPQGGEFSSNVTTEMQLRRNRSTRALWDPAYTDETWIGTQVRLVPRMKEWVNTSYPGTKIGLTEYSWGADEHINGATAQADILGILGREGMDIATRWTAPGAGTPTYKAIKMYRNYDGAKSTFGDTSVSCTVPNPDTLSAFASQDTTTGAVKVMIVSKALSGTTPVNLNLSNFAPGTTANVYQLTSANVISRLPDISVSGSSVALSTPAQSVTLLVIAKAAAAPPPPVETVPAAPSGLVARAASPTQVSLSWTDNSSNETGFEIERQRRGTSDIVVKTVGANVTTFTDSGMIPGKTYYYYVRAVNAKGKSANSNGVFFISR